MNETKDGADEEDPSYLEMLHNFTIYYTNVEVIVANFTDKVLGDIDQLDEIRKLKSSLPQVLNLHGKAYYNIYCIRF